MEHELLEVYRKLENERKKKTEAQKERNRLRNEIQSAKTALEVAQKRLTEISEIITTKTTTQIQPANTITSRNANDSPFNVHERLDELSAKAEMSIQSRLQVINSMLETILSEQSNFPKIQAPDIKPVPPARVKIEEKKEVLQEDILEDEDSGVDVWKQFEETEHKKNKTPIRPTPPSHVPNPGPSKSSTSISASNLSDLLAKYNTPPKPKQTSKPIESPRQPNSSKQVDPNWYQHNSAALMQKAAEAAEKQPAITNAVRSPPFIPSKIHAPSSIPPPSVIPALSEHTATVIWLHSVGEIGDMWKDVVLPHMRNLPWVKMLFPTASVNHVSDIKKNATSWWNGLADMETLPHGDERNIEASVLKTILLVNHEIMQGIEPDRIILAGVSQGAMIAFRTAYILLSQEIGGVVTMSARLKPNLDFNLIGGNKITVPLFVTANEEDPHISVEGLKQDIKAIQDAAFQVACKFYPQQKHLPNTNTIGDVMEWILERLPRVFEKKESAIKWM